MINKCETFGMKYKFATVFQNTQTLEIIYQNTNVYVVIEIIKKDV